MYCLLSASLIYLVNIACSKLIFRACLRVGSNIAFTEPDYFINIPRYDINCDLMNHFIQEFKFNQISRIIILKENNSNLLYTILFQKSFLLKGNNLAQQKDENCAVSLCNTLRHTQS